MPDTVVKRPRKTVVGRARPLEFLSGGGEMGRRMRALEWSGTPLGATDRWPTSLRTAVRILLTSRQPMLLFWGERLVTLYNDAAKGVISGKHPHLLGEPVAVAWQEMGAAIGAMLQSVRARNEAAYEHSAELPTAPAGKSSPERFAISFSPIPDDEGGAGGVLCLLNETATMHEAVIELSSEFDVEALAQKAADAGRRLTKARLGVFERTFEGTEPIRIDDVTKEPRNARGKKHVTAPRHAPVRSFLAVPVVSRTGEVLGALSFSHPEPAMFDERAERNARAIAAHTAVAMDNANLFAIARGEIEERSRIQLALADSERRYRDVVQGLPAAVYTTDADGRILLFNEAAVDLWGRRPAVGVDLWWGSQRIFAPSGEEIPLPESPMARVLEGQLLTGGQEIVIERPDGTRRHGLTHPRRIHDASGTVIGAVNMIVDVTEQKRAERELADTRDELAAQLEALARLHEMAIKLTSVDDEETALRTILETAVALQGADFGSISLHDRDRGVLVLRASIGLDEQEISAVEKTTTPIATRGGNILGVLSVHFKEGRRLARRDVQLAELCARHAADAVEHHHARQAVRESERLYRAIGESMNYGVWVCDEKGHNVYVSESFLRLTGLTQGTYAKSIWSTILHPDDAERARLQWKACVAEGCDWEAQVQVKTVNGDFRAILSRGVAIRDESGRITGWAGMNLDIDRLKRVEDELRELDQRKNEFLATLAHELRNPLAPIRNGLEIMRLGRGNPGMVEQARTMMERQLHQMIRLVDDLLDVSRVSRGKIELRKAPVELATALSNAIETAKPLIDQNGQSLVVNIPESPITVHADLTRLSQVFANLLNNAAKYTDKGGRIEVDVAARGSNVEVRVKDDGIGIPPEMLERIFGIFTQVDRSLEKARGGLGIGLSIARRLVEMHGGSVVAHSAGAGCGSEFVVLLPVIVSHDLHEAGEEPAALRRMNVHRRRVLVADDNLDSATSLSLMLQMMGNEVRVAHDGVEALAVAESFHPDAVLLDIGMPGLNGYEVCRKLRERASTARAMIVALTGWGQEDDRRRSREFGFDQHLVKPVEPGTLENVLSSGLRGS